MMQYLAQNNGVSWWFDPQTEDMEMQLEDCLGG
jgi:hypothetical protein